MTYIIRRRSRTMEKIELTEEQINYIADHIEMKFRIEEHNYDLGMALGIENAIEAYNSGAR